MNSNIWLKFSIVGGEFNPGIKKVKGKGISFCDMKAYKGSRTVASLILNFVLDRRKWLAFTHLLVFLEGEIWSSTCCPGG
jgi:hypothetical protein